MSYLAFKHRHLAVMACITVGIMFSTGTAGAQTASRNAADKSGTVEKSAQTGGKDAQESNSPGKDNMSPGDISMMRDLAQMNLAEIQMSGMALGVTANNAVRSFAQTMLDEHGNAMTELRKLADAKGAILPGGPGREHAATLKQLSLLTGDEFNRQFLAQAGTSAHEQSARLLEEVSSRAKDAELKAYAAKYLPIVNQHMKLVQQMQGTNQAPAASAK